jgi:hypothetical protein
MLKSENAAGWHVGGANHRFDDEDRPVAGGDGVSHVPEHDSDLTVGAAVEAG